MIRCVVSKELTVIDATAGEVLRLMQSGFAVRFVGDEAHKVERIRRKRRRAPNVTPQQVSQMVELRKKGLAHRIIARRFGLSMTAASRHVRDAMKSRSK